VVGIAAGKWWRSEEEPLTCYEWHFQHAALRCEECQGEARAEAARHWRAYLFVIEEGEPPEVVVYCPDCAEREFGEAGRPQNDRAQR
jgi:hypothetical protein